MAAAQHGDVPGAKRPIGLGLLVEDHPIRAIGDGVADAGGQGGVLQVNLAIEPPDGERGVGEPILGSHRAAEGVIGRRQPHGCEGRSESGVDEVDDALAAAVGGRQDLLRLGGCRGDAIKGGLGQGAVGIAEAVDRLLRVPNPGAGVDQLGHRREDGDLQGAGVLELIDEYPADAFPQALRHRRVTQDLERQGFLIDEIHQAAL